MMIDVMTASCIFLFLGFWLTTAAATAAIILF